MMQTSVRAFVLVLALAGLASTVTAKAAHSKATVLAGATTHNIIIPTCAPSDPNHCGLD